MIDIDIAGGGSRARELARAQAQAVLADVSAAGAGARVVVAADVFLDNRCAPAVIAAIAAGRSVSFTADVADGPAEPERAAIVVHVDDAPPAATMDSVGVWFARERPFTPVDEGTPRLLVLSHAAGATGYATGGRNLMLGLRGAGVDVAWSSEFSEFADPGLVQSEMAMLHEMARRPLHRGDPTLVFRPATRFDGALELAEFTARITGPSIAYTMFETDGYPARYRASLEAYDHVWVASHATRHAFAEAGFPSDRMTVVPISIDMPRYDCDGPRAELTARRRTAFLSIFDWTERKGADVLLRAWASAFGPDDDVVLYIRTGHSTTSAGGSIAELAASLALDPSKLAPIVLLSAVLPQTHYETLLRSVDAFVLPTRGEGFCIPMLEAMATGIPVIGTNCGGTSEFLDSRTGMALPFRMQPISNAMTDRLPLYRDQRWAEPDLDAAVDALRDVARGGDDIVRRAAVGRARAHATFDRRIIGRRTLPALHAARHRRYFQAVALAQLDGPIFARGTAGQTTRALATALRSIGVAVSLDDSGAGAVAVPYERARELRDAALEPRRATLIAVDPVTPGATIAVLTHAPAAPEIVAGAQAIWATDAALANALAQDYGYDRVRLVAPGPDFEHFTPDSANSRTPGSFRVLVGGDPDWSEAAVTALRHIDDDGLELNIFTDPDGMDDTQAGAARIQDVLRRSGRTAPAQFVVLTAGDYPRANALFVGSADVAIVDDPSDARHDILRGAALPLVATGDAALLTTLRADPALRARRGHIERGIALARAARAQRNVREAFEYAVAITPPADHRFAAPKVQVRCGSRVTNPTATVRRLGETARLPLGGDEAPFVAFVDDDVMVGEGWDDVLTAALFAHPQYRVVEPLWSGIPRDHPFAAMIPGGEHFAVRWRRAFLSNMHSGSPSASPLAPFRVARRSDGERALQGAAWVAFSVYAEHFGAIRR